MANHRHRSTEASDMAGQFFAGLGAAPSFDDELAGVARQLIELTLDVRRTPANLRVLGDELHEMAGRLDGLDEELAADADGANPMEDGYLQRRVRRSPTLGSANPIAPPLRLEMDGRAIRGEATFARAYEGPPGHVHGGTIAAAFDTVLSAVAVVEGELCVTHRLAVHYRHLVPLGEVIEFEGRLARRTGRRLVVVGEATYQGRVLATARAALAVMGSRWLEISHSDPSPIGQALPSTPAGASGACVGH